MNLTKKNPQVSIAIKRINEAAEILNKQVGQHLTDKVEEYDSYLEKIEKVKTDLADLTQQYSVKKEEAEKTFKEYLRVEKFNTDMLVKENALETFRNLSGSLGYYYMTLDEHTELENKVTEVEVKLQEAVSAAVKSNTQKLEMSHKESTMDLNMRNKELEFVCASQLATIKTLKEQLVKYTEQINKLQDTITQVANAEKTTYISK